MGRSIDRVVVLLKAAAAILAVVLDRSRLKESRWDCKVQVRHTDLSRDSPAMESVLPGRSRAVAVAGRNTWDTASLVWAAASCLAQAFLVEREGGPRVRGSQARCPF